MADKIKGQSHLFQAILIHCSHLLMQLQKFTTIQYKQKWVTHAAATFFYLQ